jgi:hypothetical protein
MEQSFDGMALKLKVATRIAATPEFADRIGGAF